MAQDDQTVILALSIAFPILALASIILRFESRRIKRLKLEADDWTVLAALLINIAATVAILIDSRLGNVEGLDVSIIESNPLNNRQYAIFSKSTYAFELLVWPCVGLTKISVLLLYRRIFVNPTTGAFRILVWSSIWLAVAWTITMEFTSMFSCVPISSRWDPTLQSSCINQLAFYIAALSTDVITDGLILLLPIYKLQKLQMPIQRKLAVIGIFGLGALVTVIGIIRLHFVTLADVSVPSALSGGISHSYDAAAYWTIIETSAGILSACLPTLRPLYQGYRIDAMVSTLSSFCRGSRLAIRPRDNIRLNSLEQGFSHNAKKVPGRHAGDPFAIYDETDIPLQRLEVPQYREDGQSRLGSEE